jgi:glycosyltransferase involved in cell wall biosynthesis
MASECPIVASNIPSNMEVIHDGKTGLLFETTEPDDLGNKIILLASDISLRDRLAKGARSLVEAEFTLEKLISRTNQFYEGLIEKKRRRAG